jgi:pilus assembly protein TadC
VEALEATNRLEVKVVVPLGLLVLPAFVLVGILPMGVAMWNQAQLA